jgi:hypothetical protein
LLFLTKVSGAVGTAVNRAIDAVVTSGRKSDALRADWSYV